MTKREWPKEFGGLAIEWCENNLCPQELDRIALIVEEPITITKTQFYRALADEIKSQYLDQEYAKGYEPPIHLISRAIGGLWERLKS